MIITDEDNNENANELMTRESFDCQNGHYKLTGLCENTISFTFKLLQSNNPISIQILNKFRNWRGGGREIRGGDIAPPLWLRPLPWLNFEIFPLDF